MRKVFVLALITLPFVDFYLLFVAAAYLNAWLTLGLTVFTSVLGFLILRQQPGRLFLSVRADLQQGVMPQRSMIESAIVICGALLLMFPGFITDIFGLATLIPSVRERVAQRVIYRFFSRLSTPPPQTPTAKSTRIIDGDYRRED